MLIRLQREIVIRQFPRVTRPIDWSPPWRLWPDHRNDAIRKLASVYGRVPRSTRIGHELVACCGSETDNIAQHWCHDRWRKEG